MDLGNVLIMGDSYSTFSGYIPQGYLAYYTPDGGPGTDVNAVEQTWWHLLLSRNPSRLLLNNSWSGSTVCYTGYEGVDCSRSSSFIYRWRQLVEQGFFRDNRVDTVFFFGGTNDSWAQVPLGEPAFQDPGEEALYRVLPAAGYFLNLMRQTLPEARIYCLINTELLPQLQQTMLEGCRRFGIRPVTFTHIHTGSGHPTVQGMQDIARQVQQQL